MPIPRQPLPTRPTHRRRQVLMAGLGALASSPWAQEPARPYPSRTITLVVPYTAGGSSDIRARQIAQKMASALGKPVIVDNKPGGAGNIGTEFIARAAPDGHTIGMGNLAPLSVNRHLYPRMNFDPLADLVPVVFLEKGPLVLVVNATSPYKTVKDLVQAGMAGGGKMNYASGGPGGSHHLAAEMFKDRTGVQATHIPYRGGSPATNDLIAGNVDFMFEWIVQSVPYTKSLPPKLRALAIASARRSAQLPDTPTFAELGIPGMEISNWFGVVAPKGTPRPMVDRLNQVINQALGDPELRERVQTQGNEIVGGTPEEFSAYIKAESVRWGELIRAKKIQAD